MIIDRGWGQQTCEQAQSAILVFSGFRKVAVGSQPGPHSADCGFVQHCVSIHVASWGSAERVRHIETACE